MEEKTEKRRVLAPKFLFWVRLTVIIALIVFAVLLPSRLAALELRVDLDQSQLLAGSPTRAYLKIGVVGETNEARPRPSLNVALVLDKSGSMDGEKIKQAKEAARYAVSLLSPKDYLSLVVYDSEVEVLLPATRVENPQALYRLINSIEPGSSTALFAGVSRGAREIRKYLDLNRVNRVILLSDGLANVGPDSPASLADLGSGLRREGISVSTIGLGSGYNEDLMARLAGTSDGNHAFVESPRDLVRIFDAEFKDVFAVAALDVKIQIDFRPGVKPLRIVNREGDIRGQSVFVNLNQVLSSQEKYLLLEIEIPAGSNGQVREIANTKVLYRDLSLQKNDSRQNSTSVSYTADVRAVQRSVKQDVREQVVLQLATETNERALELRDDGKVEEAKKLLEDNANYLQEAAAALPQAEALKDYAEQNREEAEKIQDEDWQSQRKSMKESQMQNKTQRSY